VAVTVHTVDLHVDGPVDRCGATRWAVVRLVGFVLAEHADLVVSRRRVRPGGRQGGGGGGRFFASEMGRLGDAGITGRQSLRVGTRADRWRRPGGDLGS
jgi:hypothetical protein